METDRRKLKRAFLKQYRVAIIGAFLILISFLGDYLGDKIYYNIALERKVDNIQDEIWEKEEQAYSIIEKLKASNSIDLESTAKTLLNNSKKYHLFTYIYQNNKLAFWTSNKVMPSLTSQVEDAFVLQKLPNGYYLQLNESEDYLEYKILIPVQYCYPIENNYLKNKFLFENDFFRLVLDDDDRAPMYTIKSSKGHSLFKISPKNEAPSSSWIVYIYILGGFLIFTFLDSRLKELLQKKELKKFYISLSAILLITFLGWQGLRFPEMLFESRFFSPKLYANSNYFRSLGDLFLTIFIIFWLTNLLTNHYKPKRKLKTHSMVIMGFLSFSMLLLFSHLISRIIKGLVLDSSITLDMSEFLDLNFFSILSFAIIFLLLFAYVKLSMYLMNYLVRLKPKYIHWVIIILIPSFLFYFGLKARDDFQILQLLFPAVIWFLIILYPSFKNTTLNYYLAFILISSGFAAHQIIRANNDKEHENRQHLITTLATYRDVSGERLLQEKINQIRQDNYIRYYFSNPFIPISELKKRIRKIYFSGYFTRYDFSIYTFAADDSPYKNKFPVNLEDFRTRMELGQFTDNSNWISFINSFDGAPEYIIYIPLVSNNVITGQMIIDLKQKPFLEESVYPELLVEQHIKRSEEIKNYSFAIYNNGILANQQGNYSYPLTLSSELFTLDDNFFFYKENNYEHLAFKQQSNVIILMSKELSSIFNSLSLFSVLFILGTIILSAGISMTNKEIYINLMSIFQKNYWAFLLSNINITFKSKIQMTILVSIFFALGLTGYSTINYIKIKQLKNTNNKLSEEINSIKNDLVNYFIENSYVIDPSNLEGISSKISNLAYLFHADINIFDTDGNLITSSQMPIYEREIITKKMDAEAFYNLRILQKSHLIQNEKIGGKIIYQSAYALIRNSNNQILYFINIPYLAREKELRQQITSLIVTIFNLYVFLFLFIILISFAISNTFTEPLEIIKKHLSGVQVGKINEKISWKSNDEIGSLIHEYNAMISKVEESAEALAKSERETAWREMAKQVAHEIKNPLTPMKLSIQQLIRSWVNKDPNINERFNKTTQVLINRIESLSRIATEFSQFARMPIPVNKEMILENTIREVSELLGNSEKARIKLELNTENTTIISDEQQLARALNNLIKNGIQAIPPDQEGLIEIRTKYKGQLVELSISDNGSGIPEDIRDKIFRPNFSTKSSGMGLGLAIVARIIQNSNGNIWFETELNKGTTFFIEFQVQSKDKNTEIV